MSAFYEQVDDDTFESSPRTAGPWSAKSQHAGPPSALLTRAIERFEPREGHRIGRVSIDILGAVPVAPLRVDVERLRPGRRIELVEARARSGDRTVLVARAWRVACTPEDFPAPPSPTLDPPDIPPTREAGFPAAHVDGYLASVDFRFETGSFAEPGPARAWGRQLVGLLADEEPTGWQRTMLLADSGSGISLALDPAQHPAINCDLSVALHRDPSTEWIGLDSRTDISPGSGALTTTALLDRTGPIGRATQTLLAG